MIASGSNGGIDGFFFDNMNDRPIREPQWREYTIEGPVAEDALNIAFGVMLEGGGITAGFDHVRLSVSTKQGQWEPVAIVDGGFETDQGWRKAGTAVEMANLDRPDREAPQGKHWMKITLAKEFTPKPISSAQPKRGERVSVPLSTGLSASVPLVLDDETVKITPQQSSALAALKKEIEQMSNARDKSTSMADVVTAWAVLRHFYPYWDVVDVNWDNRLVPSLQSAATENGTCEAHSIVMRRFLAEIKDGHAGVYDQNISYAYVPIAARLVEGQMIVAGSKTDEVSAGDVIVAINGQSAREWFLQKHDLISGSNAWRVFNAAEELESGPKDTIVRLTVEQKDSTRKDVELIYKEEKVVREVRPEAVTELHSGVWYIDLTRATSEVIKPKLPDLAKAKGVVFDVRGYPTDAGADILPHLIDAAEHDRWMHIPHFLAPGGLPAEWTSEGWDLEPEEPKVTANRIFLTDGRAISYAESVMGYIKDSKLAFIIGSTTAGTNGNIVRVELPSGLNFFFTGMQVTDHDGKSRFHGLGVEPDKVVKPTLAGIRAGRDEQLESAIEYLEGK